jgi:hypothetical protein
MLASSGEVDIGDAGQVRRVVLTGDELRRGSLTYRHEGRDVAVALRIDQKPSWLRLNDTRAETRFVAPAEQAPAVIAAEVSEPPVPAALTEGDAARTENVEPLRQPEPPPQKAAPEPQVEESRPVRRVAVIPVNVPASFAERKQSQPVAPPAPSLSLPSPDNLQLAMGTPTLPAPGAVGVPRPAAGGATPRIPTYSGPRSGRIIWTGSMARRGVVEIEGSHASIGSISGALPGVPVTVRVSPAEFSTQGLIVHSADAMANNRQEKPSSENGWNATRFVWEPDRARELVVLEAPNPSNDFKRLAVRNDARSCSVLIVEWAVK